MKHQKPKTHSAKFFIKTHHTAKRRVKNNRPLHRTIAFHPINLLFLLCAGVLLSVSTIGAVAASYSVNSEVLAPVPTTPAVITSPVNNQQLNSPVQLISGTCPSNTYVEMSDNNTVAGIAICSQANSFHVTVSLTSGLNVLSAQVFNVTNHPGPTASSINVYYDPPTTPSNSPGASAMPRTSVGTQGDQSTYVAPVSVKVLQVDTNTPFQPVSGTPVASYEPTLTGIAPPHSLVTVTIHTNPYYCHTYANADGYWSCTFSQIIPPGQHTVMITAQTPSKQTITLPSFHITIAAVVPKSPAAASKFAITTNYTYRAYLLNQPVTLNLHSSGGVAPFTCTVAWGDGAISTYVEQTDKDFSITHTYSHLNAGFGSMPVKIAAIDTKGDFSSLEVDTALRNPGFAGGATSANTSGFLTALYPWLTVLWPGYIIVLLMIFSFWLGERQEMIKLLSSKKLMKRPQHRHSH